MLIGYEIDDAHLQYALGACALAVVIGYGVLYVLRKRSERRSQPNIDIPHFLRDGPNTGDNSGSRADVDCLEVYGVRRKAR